MNPEDIAAQNTLNQMKNAPQSPSVNSLSTTFGSCPQCGMSHPPIPPGETCPNASIQQIQTSGPVKITDQEFNQFLVNMKNILVSQLDQIEVTNAKEIFKVITLKVMEALEELKKQ